MMKRFLKDKCELTGTMPFDVELDVIMRENQELKT